MDTSEEYCSSKLQIIPQFSGTCWFNAILTVMLYSDNFRRYLKSHFESLTEYPRNDKLFIFLLYMLKYHNRIDKLEKVYKGFKNFRLKTEYLLFSYLNKYDPEVKEFMKKKTKKDYESLGFKSIYICHILKTYNIPFINLIKYNNNIYIDANINKLFNFNYDDDDAYSRDRNYLNQKANRTDILIVNHNYSDFYDLRNIPEYKKKIYDDTLFDSINNIEKEITINSNVFVLDSCIITNSYGSLVNTRDNALSWHAISGITCGNNQFLVDSKDAYKIKGDTFTLNENNNLLKFKWYDNLLSRFNISISYDGTTNKQKITTNQSASLAQNLVLDMSRNKLSYNFDKSNIFFIYIKNRDIVSRTSSVALSSISIKKLELSSKEISQNIKSYYDIYNLTPVELLNKIKKLYRFDDSITIDVFQNVKDKFNYVFNNYFNMEIDITKSNDELLKILFGNLIIHYIKHGKLLKFETDETIIKRYIANFITYNNTDIGNYITKTYNKLFVSPDNIAEFSKILFTEYSKYYDKYLTTEIADDIRRLLIRIILDKEIFKEDYITKYYISTLSSLSIPILYERIQKYELFNIGQLKKNINDYNSILFIFNRKYYDDDLSQTITEINKKTLIRILLDKIIFNENFISLYKIHILNSLNIQNLIIKIKQDYIFDVDIKNIDDYFTILFTDNPKYYDKGFIDVKVESKTKKVLIRILLDYEFFDVNFITTKKIKR